MKLVLHADAGKDLDALIDYIAHRAGLKVADKQLVRAFDALQAIEQFPRASRYDAELNVYEAWLPRTRFIVFYRLFPKQNMIVVLAVIDHARNTARTKRRIVMRRE
jgi:plasmid stabilization system protein ParE